MPAFSFLSNIFCTDLLESVAFLKAERAEKKNPSVEAAALRT